MTESHKDDEDPATGRRILALCDAAVNLSDADRDEFLSASCGGDHDLRAAVESVLQAIVESGTFLSLDIPGEDGELF